MSGQSMNGDGLYRLSPEEVLDQAARDAQSIYHFAGPDGNPVEQGCALLVQALDAISAAPVTLPADYTAVELGIRAQAAAAAAGTRRSYEPERQVLQSRLAEERGNLVSAYSARERAAEHLRQELDALEEFINSLPRRVRRLRRRRFGRVAKFTPWAMWGADTLFLSSAYGLFGPVPLPFHASEAVTNVTQVLRAALVSFGLVFGGRLVGAKLREFAEELRAWKNAVGIVCDAAIAAVVVLCAVKLIGATALLQQAYLAIVGGGTTVHVPASVLVWVTGFLASISVAAGYYLNEPELEEVRDRERRVEEAKTAFAEAEREANTKLGIVRAAREELRSLDQREQHELAENDAHVDRRVRDHQAGNVAIYGLQPPLTAPGHATP